MAAGLDYRRLRSDTDEFVPPPPGADTEPETVSAPTRDAGASDRQVQEDADGFAANPFQKRKGPSAKDDSDSDDDDKDDGKAGDGTNREIKPKFAIVIRAADADSPASEPASTDLVSSLKGISISVVRRSTCGTEGQGDDVHPDGARAP